MKQAFVNCWIMPWWVQNVLIDLIQSEKFTEAKVFTLFSDKKSLTTSKWNIDIVTALPVFLNNLFIKFSKKSGILWSILDYRNLIFFYPYLTKILSQKITKYWAPKVTISSFAVAKNLQFCHKDYNWIYKPITQLYLHSPMQYIRSHYKEYSQKIQWYKSKIFQYIVPKLKKRDLNYNQYDKVHFNSQYTQDLAEKLYNIQWEVRYPKIDENFYTDINLEPQNYYVYVWRLVKFVKELDKIIKLFNQTKEHLIIIWSGPDEKYLKSIAHWNIIFVWRIQDIKEKQKIIKNAKWMINITKESFGICTVEWLLSGLPIFAYNDWASPELIDHNSWILVPDKTHKTLVEEFQKFTQHKWDRKLIQNNINAKLKKHPR